MHQGFYLWLELLKRTAGILPSAIRLKFKENEFFSSVGSESPLILQITYELFQYKSSCGVSFISKDATSTFNDP